VHEVDAGHHLEYFASNMIDAAAARRRHIGLSGVGTRVCDEFRNGLGGYRWVDHHHRRNAKNAGDRFNIPDEIEVEIIVERRIDRVCLRDPKKRVAVRRGVHYRVGGDIGARAGPIFDDELLAEQLRQPLRDQPRGDVGRSG
jgi:hypothetical protein